MIAGLGSKASLRAAGVGACQCSDLFSGCCLALYTLHEHEPVILPPWIEESRRAPGTRVDAPGSAKAAAAMTGSLIGAARAAARALPRAVAGQAAGQAARVFVAALTIAGVPSPVLLCRGRCSLERALLVGAPRARGLCAATLATLRTAQNSRQAHSAHGAPRRSCRWPGRSGINRTQQ